MRLADLNRLLAPLKNRIANMVGRAVVKLVNDAGGIQVLQLGVGADETRDTVERFGEYGFTSVPLSGAEAVVVFVGGRRDHGLVVGVDDRRYRKSGLQPGEVAVYHKDGAHVLLKADGSIEVKSLVRVAIDAPSVDVSATNVAVTATSTELKGGTVTMLEGVLPVAREGSALTGTAGPYSIVGTVAVGAGSPNVKVP